MKFNSLINAEVIFIVLCVIIAEGLVAEQAKLTLAPETVRPQFAPPEIPPKAGSSYTRKPQPISMGWNDKTGKIGRLTGRHGQPFPGLPVYSRNIFVAAEDGRIKLPNGEELWIDQIEMIYQTGPGDEDVSFAVFDGITLEPETSDANRTVEKCYEPTLKLKFAGPKNLEVADTTIQFANGVPFKQNGIDRGYWDTETKLGFSAPLHSMPVVVMSQFQYGEAKSFSIPLEIDSVYRNEDFEVRVIACTYFPPGAESAPVEVGERGKELEIRDLAYQPLDLNDGRTICCLEVVPINSFPLSFKRIGGGLISFHRYDQRVEFLQVGNTDGMPPKELEFTYRDRGLAIFNLPKIPGVPQENENLENIFDLKIPFVELEDATDHFWFIANHAGLVFSAHYERYPYPEVNYPISYANVTLMDMLEDMRTRYGIHEFILDGDNVLVEITDPK